MIKTAVELQTPKNKIINEQSQFNIANSPIITEAFNKHVLEANSYLKNTKILIGEESKFISDERILNQKAKSDELMPKIKLLAQKVIDRLDFLKLI